MYPQTDLTIASLIVADGMRHAEIARAWDAARSRSGRPRRFAFSIRTAFGRRPVAGAAR